jgi:hypothetical protein
MFSEVCINVRGFQVKIQQRGNEQREGKECEHWLESS